MPWCKSQDLECDFIMVYRLDESTLERIRQYRKKGYVVHLMTGISWGHYQDYLNGGWDGREHWDEGQMERSGKPVIHSPTVPYVVPAVSFSNYLVELLKPVIDAGVDAIHMEEPEFWDRCGYSESFKREYEIYYKEPWRPQHEDLDAHYKAARLKVYLFSRTLDRVSAGLKEYAKVLYHRDLEFYVPTHSLLNYMQWKIMSPESALIDIPTVDGYIAQVWTGTSRTPNVYNGICKERTFETAYLEYGAMQELVRGTGRRMWFLHDPIEDNLIFTWEDYRRNYIKTVTASLLHPCVWHYEICPWPDRVFEGVYPRYQPYIAQKDETSFPAEGAKPIPQSYSTLLSSMFQMLGDMEQQDIRFEGVNEGVGILISDSGLYQRSYPDGFTAGENFDIMRIKDEADETLCRNMIKKVKEDPSLMPDFLQSKAFPGFYGQAMPLLKYGLPVRPVQLDNVRRFAGYLDDIRFLVLSYEYIKPEAADMNMALIAWVNRGGTLFYMGNGRDPYHGISSWWRSAGYENPAMHLFEMAGLPRNPANGTYRAGKGRIIVWNVFPAEICLEPELAEQYRTLVREALAEAGIQWEYRNDLTLQRGPYLISSVMEESVNRQNKVLRGLYADMLENDYRIIREKVIAPDESAILFDFSKIEGETFRIIGTSARIYSADMGERQVTLRLKAADRIKVFTRIRLPGKVTEVKAVSVQETVDGTASGNVAAETGVAGTAITGNTDTGSAPGAAAGITAEFVMEKAISWQWDETTRTALLSYDSTDEMIVVTMKYEGV